MLRCDKFEGGSLQDAKRRCSAGTALIFAALAALSLGACATKRPHSEQAVVGKDIHESISLIGNRHGFHDGIRTIRDDGRGLDYTFMRLPLDGVKTRHYSLDNVLKGIGTVIAQPEFAKLPINIEIRASDETDRLYMRDALTHAIAGRASVDVNLRPATYSGIVITVARLSPAVR